MITKRPLLLLLLLSVSLGVCAQLNTKLRDRLAYGEGVNDVWGYVAPDGTEYAIVGLLNGVSFVSLADPDNLVEVARVRGVRSVWRDMKTYGEYAYSVADERAEGITAFDLRHLPDSVPVRRNVYDIPGFDNPFVRSHNLYVDTASARLFTAGGLRTINDGGVLIFDLATDPMTPTLIGLGPETYAHDVFVLGDTMYCSEIYDGEVAVYNIARLDSIYELGTATTPARFTHNAWTTADGQVVFTTDETGNAPVAAFDLSDKADIRKLDEYRPLGSLDSRTIPHNVHVIDDYLSVSYYTDGLRVVDASVPDNLIEVANYDTWPGPNGGFNGNWGAYPYLPSGLTLVSDRQTGLYVVEVDYRRAARLRGTLTDLDVGTPVNDVMVTLNSLQPNEDRSDALGRYRTGLADGGTYEVTFSAPNYDPLTVTVDLENGRIVTLDTTLTPKIRRYDVALTVVDAVSGTVLPGATVLVRGNDRTETAVADAAGLARIDDVFEGDYDLYVARWGYLTHALAPVNPRDLTADTIHLNRGYMDDFVTDQGWTVSGTATGGTWERGVPAGTNFGADPLAPATDAADDLGASAYVTGNDGITAGDDDVDEGVTELISPPFGVLPRQDDDLVVSYQYWFANISDTTPLDDTLTIRLTDGTDTVVARRYSGYQAAWVADSFRVADYLPGSVKDLRLLVSTGDSAENGHLVEAGFDNFRVRATFWATSTEAEGANVVVTAFPNPSPGAFHLRYAGLPAGPVILQVTDLAGRRLGAHRLPGTAGTFTLGQELPGGLYFLELRVGNRRLWSGKVVRE